MTGKFLVPDEKRRFADDRFEFLYSELIYAQKTLPSEETNPYFRNLHQHLACLLRILRTIREQEIKITDPLKQLYRSQFIIDKTYMQLPDNLQQVVASLLQIRQRGLRHYMSSGTPQYALSDIHIAYSLGVRAVDSVNMYIHEALTPFFQCFKRVHAPIIAISSGDSYKLHRPRFTGIIGWPLEFQAAINEIDAIEYAVNLCRLILPRWFITNVRYCSIFAHEHYHRVQIIIEFCQQWMRDHTPSEDPEIRLKKKEGLAARQRFGDPIYWLSIYKLKIEDGYRRYFDDERWIGDEKHSRKSILDNLFRQANELIADACAVTLSGPAYSYALFASIQFFDFK